MARQRNRRTEPKKAHRKRNNRRKLGQNFLKDERTARRLVAASGVGAGDLVLEIGAGDGMLTRPLAKAARRVMAIECDPYWAALLRERFTGTENVEVVETDFLAMTLPAEPFVVVANVPFGVTTPILHRLLDDPESPMRWAYLAVQRQVALKHARASPTTLKTLTWSPWYEFSAGPELPASLFRPRPGVDACLLVAARRGPQLVDVRLANTFRAFVRRAFDGPGNAVGRTLRPFFTRVQLRRLARDNGFNLRSPPSALTVQQWAAVFRFMVSAVPRERWPPRGRRGRAG